jgi:hypothetical protein
MGTLGISPFILLFATALPLEAAVATAANAAALFGPFMPV